MSTSVSREFRCKIPFSPAGSATPTRRGSRSSGAEKYRTAPCAAVSSEKWKSASVCTLEKTGRFSASSKNSAVSPSCSMRISENSFSPSILAKI